MRMSFDLVLDRGREEVWKAFDNPVNMKKWQPTLRSFEPVSGTPGQVGAVSKLTYDEKGRTIVLTETITMRRHPDAFAGTYDSGMGLNSLENKFTEESPGRTKWVMDSEFTFRGVWKLLAPVMRKAFQKRVREDMERFKSMLESNQLSV